MKYFYTLVISLSLANLSHGADKLDGKPSGSDERPTDCANPYYSNAQFYGIGALTCMAAKKLNVTFTALHITSAVASTVEVKNRCNFEYSEIGLNGVTETQNRFPKTWEVYLNFITGAPPATSCQQARISWPLVFK